MTSMTPPPAQKRTTSCVTSVNRLLLPAVAAESRVTDTVVGVLI